MKKLMSLLAALFITSNVFANGLSLKANAPDRYVVQPGDTLWGIAETFLDKPWQWQKIWRANPAIKNPDRIYPGAMLVLRNNGGSPFLEMIRAGTVRLSPKVRKLPIDNAIPSIPLNEIRPFLLKTLVLNHDELSVAPYVVAYAGNHLMAGPGVRIYVKGLEDPDQQGYNLYRHQGVYVDPVTKEPLGYVAQYVGESELHAFGDPSVLLVTSVDEGVVTGDRVFRSEEQDFQAYFELKEPKVQVDAQVIALFGGLTQVGTHQVLVINRGARDGLDAGNVLAVYKLGVTVADPVQPGAHVNLPNERIGELLIFRVFDKVSFGLVMSAIEPIRKFYLVTNP